jgi:hypothetical protein
VENEVDKSLYEAAKTHLLRETDKSRGRRWAAAAWYSLLFVVVGGERGEIFKRYGDHMRVEGNVDYYLRKSSAAARKELKQTLSEEALLLPPPPSGTAALLVAISFVQFLTYQISEVDFAASRGKRWRWSPPVDCAAGIVSLLSELIGLPTSKGVRAVRRAQKLTYCELEGVSADPTRETPEFYGQFSRCGSGIVLHCTFFAVKGLGRFVNAKIMSAAAEVVGTYTGVLDRPAVELGADAARLPPQIKARLRDMDRKRFGEVVLMDLGAGALSGFTNELLFPTPETLVGCDSNGAHRMWLPFVHLEAILLRQLATLGPLYIAMLDGARPSMRTQEGFIRMATQYNSRLVVPSAQDMLVCTGDRFTEERLKLTDPRSAAGNECQSQPYPVFYFPHHCHAPSLVPAGAIAVSTALKFAAVINADDTKYIAFQGKPGTAAQAKAAQTLLNRAARNPDPAIVAANGAMKVAKETLDIAREKADELEASLLKHASDPIAAARLRTMRSLLKTYKAALTAADEEYVASCGKFEQAARCMINIVAGPRVVNRSMSVSTKTKVVVAGVVVSDEMAPFRRNAPPAAAKKGKKGKGATKKGNKGKTKSSSLEDSTSTGIDNAADDKMEKPDDGFAPLASAMQRALAALSSAAPCNNGGRRGGKTPTPVARNGDRRGGKTPAGPRGGGRRRGKAPAEPRNAMRSGGKATAAFVVPARFTSYATTKLKVVQRWVGDATTRNAQGLKTGFRQWKMQWAMVQLVAELLQRECGDVPGGCVVTSSPRVSTRGNHGYAAVCALVGKARELRGARLSNKAQWDKAVESVNLGLSGLPSLSREQDCQEPDAREEDGDDSDEDSGDSEADSEEVIDVSSLKAGELRTKLEQRGHDLTGYCCDTARAGLKRGAVRRLRELLRHELEKPPFFEKQVGFHCLQHAAHNAIGKGGDDVQYLLSAKGMAETAVDYMPADQRAGGRNWSGYTGAVLIEGIRNTAGLSLITLTRGKDSSRFIESVMGDSGEGCPVRGLLGFILLTGKSGAGKMRHFHAVRHWRNKLFRIDSVITSREEQCVRITKQELKDEVAAAVKDNRDVMAMFKTQKKKHTAFKIGKEAMQTMTGNSKQGGKAADSEQLDAQAILAMVICGNCQGSHPTDRCPQTAKARAADQLRRLRLIQRSARVASRGATKGAGGQAGGGVPALASNSLASNMKVMSELGISFSEGGVLPPRHARLRVVAHAVDMFSGSPLLRGLKTFFWSLGNRDQVSFTFQEPESDAPAHNQVMTSRSGVGRLCCGLSGVLYLHM